MELPPQALKDSDEVIRITNKFARLGINIDTMKRTGDWIAFVSTNTKRWEAGTTELEAVQKLEVSLTA